MQKHLADISNTYKYLRTLSNNIQTIDQKRLKNNSKMFWKHDKKFFFEIFSKIQVSFQKFYVFRNIEKCCRNLSQVSETFKNFQIF